MRGALWGPERLQLGELVALTRHLPASGAVARAEGVWHDELELAAGNLEVLDLIARLLYGQSGKRPPWPKVHVPRPGDTSSTPARSATPERMAALLELAERRGGEG